MGHLLTRPFWLLEQLSSFLATSQAYLRWHYTSGTETIEHHEGLVNWPRSLSGFNEFAELTNGFSPLAVPNWGNASPKGTHVREVQTWLLLTTMLTRV
jgi:hypothetical protein